MHEVKSCWSHWAALQGPPMSQMQTLRSRSTRLRDDLRYDTSGPSWRCGGNRSEKLLLNLCAEFCVFDVAQSVRTEGRWRLLFFKDLLMLVLTESILPGTSFVPSLQLPGKTRFFQGPLYDGCYVWKSAKNVPSPRLEASEPQYCFTA